MSFDEGLAARIRTGFPDGVSASEKAMFGGLTFAVGGNLCCGVVGEEMIVRVGPDKHAKVLKKMHARVFDMDGRSMNGWITVGPRGCEGDNDLARWIAMGLEYVRTLPAK